MEKRRLKLTLTKLKVLSGADARHAHGGTGYTFACVTYLPGCSKSCGPVGGCFHTWGGACETFDHCTDSCNGTCDVYASCGACTDPEFTC